MTSSTPSAPSDPPAAEIGDVVERAVFLDDGRYLFGIESSPRSVSRSGRAILLLNAGAIHHVGPNRLHVAYARRWAATGDLVVRMDISGIGDSPTRPGATENVVYSEHAVGDVDLAIRWLRRQPSVKEVWAVGLCSGAYHAFKGAVAGHAMNGIVAINPLTFFWTPDTPLDPPAHRVIEESERYIQAAREPARWKRLLDGDVRQRVARTVGRQARSVVLARVRDMSRRLNMPWKDDLAAELELVAKRGVDLNFVFAKGDPGEQLLRRDGGAVIRSLSKRRALDIDVVAGPDHTFTPLWSHAPLFEMLGRAMAAR